VLTYFWALMCVFGMAAGQILFKLAANSLAETGSFLVPRTATLLFTALALYGLITIAWIWVLQKAELGKVYPMMALAFVLVPLASHWLFGERFTPQYFIGIVLIALAATNTVGWWGWLGIILLLTGLFRFCPLYRMLGICTCPISNKN